MTIPCWCDYRWQVDPLQQSCQDSRKQCPVLHQALNSSTGTVFLLRKANKSLADLFTSIFRVKSLKLVTGIFQWTIRTMFIIAVILLSLLLSMQAIDMVRKILFNTPTRSCLLDQWPTFLDKECADILLSTITKLINLSLLECCVPDGFEVHADDPKNYCPKLNMQMSAAYYCINCKFCKLLKLYDI